jgi:hypothetical protein
VTVFCVKASLVINPGLALAKTLPCRKRDLTAAFPVITSISVIPER